MRRILRNIISPPPVWSAVIIVLGGAMVIAALTVKTLSHTAFAYIAYLASAYALVVAIASLPRVFRKIGDSVKGSRLAARIRKIPLAARILDDVLLRTKISLAIGLVINSVYIVVKLITGIYYGSVWFLAMAAYYLLLAVMRGLLVLPIRDKDKTAAEYRRYRLCGAALLIMNIALSVIVALVVNEKHSPNYPGVLIYLMAAYSFYAVISAIVNVVKVRRHASPVLSAARAISLAAALVSIFSLQTAMMARFGDNDGGFRVIMSVTTGSVICAFEMGMAVIMLVRGKRARGKK